MAPTPEDNGLTSIIFWVRTIMGLICLVTAILLVDPLRWFPLADHDLAASLMLVAGLSLLGRYPKIMEYLRNRGSNDTGRDSSTKDL